MGFVKKCYENLNVKGRPTTFYQLKKPISEFFY